MNNVVTKAYKLLRKSKQVTDEPQTDQSKRSFVGGLVGASGLAVAPGVMLYETASAKPADESIHPFIQTSVIEANKKK